MADKDFLHTDTLSEGFIIVLLMLAILYYPNKINKLLNLIEKFELNLQKFILYSLVSESALVQN